MFRSVASVVGLVNLEAYTTNTLLPDVGVDGNCTAHSVDDGVKSVSNSNGISLYTVVVDPAVELSIFACNILCVPAGISTNCVDDVVNVVFLTAYKAGYKPTTWSPIAFATLILGYFGLIIISVPVKCSAAVEPNLPRSTVIF